MRTVYQNILLAVDGSLPSRRATTAATELARLANGTVVVLHVIEYTPYGRAGVAPEETPPEAHVLVNEVSERIESVGVKTRAVVEQALVGRVASVIAGQAALEASDVIVVGTRGLGDLAGLVLGSTAHKLLHVAHCPVLVVP